MAEQSDAPWWHTRDEEHLWGGEASRQAAIDAGINDYDGEPFYICQGKHFRHRTDIFDGGQIADTFDDANDEYAGDENPSSDWKAEHIAELEAELNAAMAAWVARHGYEKAWGIDAGPSERVTAEMIATRKAEIAA